MCCALPFATLHQATSSSRSLRLVRRRLRRLLRFLAPLLPRLRLINQVWDAVESSLSGPPLQPVGAPAGWQDHLSFPRL